MYHSGNCLNIRRRGGRGRVSIGFALSCVDLLGLFGLRLFAKLPRDRLLGSSSYSLIFLAKHYMTKNQKTKGGRYDCGDDLGYVLPRNHRKGRRGQPAAE